MTVSGIRTSDGIWNSLIVVHENDGRSVVRWWARSTLAGGELVVRLSPRTQDSTAEPIQPRTLAGLGLMRYVGPLTPWRPRERAQSKQPAEHDQR